MFSFDFDVVLTFLLIILSMNYERNIDKTRQTNRMIIKMMKTMSMQMMIKIIRIRV